MQAQTDQRTSTTPEPPTAHQTTAAHALSALQLSTEPPSVFEELITFDNTGRLIEGSTYIISHESALTLRRRLHLFNQNSPTGTNLARVFLIPAPQIIGLGTAVCPGAKEQPKELAYLARTGLLDSQIDLLVPTRRDRQRSTKRTRAVSFKPRLWTSAVPPRAFDEVVFAEDAAAGVPLIPIDGPATARSGLFANIFCSTKPMIYAQLARNMDEAQLAELACELCGEYMRTPGVSPGYVSREPTLSHSNLLAFLEALGWDMNHHHKGFFAAKIATDHAKSPLETTVYLLLCLPPRLGGYGVPKALLNPWIDASGHAVDGREASGDLRPDLYWESIRTVIEVYGYNVHISESAGPKKRMDDIEREAKLRARDIDMHVLTIRQIRDVKVFDSIARMLLRRLHRSHRAPSGTEWEQRRDALRAKLIPPELKVER